MYARANSSRLAVIFLILCILFKNSQQLQCVDHNNNPVDWYVAYKLPQENNPNELIKQGAAYVYMTSDDNSAQSGWKLSDKSINNTNSLIGLTLAPAYSDEKENLLYAFYNDENPDGSVSFKKGHTKGTILGDGSGGLWLIHSVPRFPRVDANQYYFPHNGYSYGQSFLCISLDLQNLDKIGIQLQYNEPNIFYKNIPSSLTTRLSNLNDALQNKVIESAPWFHLQFLSSLASQRFLSFAKGRKFAKELYEDWVAPTLNSNLSVETWLNGPGRIPSECGEYFSVYNIESVNIKPANFKFKSSTDHSKWAVSVQASNEKWICIGDINRAVAQRHRGGGTVCFSMDRVADTFQGSITKVENCPNTDTTDTNYEVFKM